MKYFVWIKWIKCFVTVYIFSILFKSIKVLWFIKNRDASVTELLSKAKTRNPLFLISKEYGAPLPLYFPFMKSYWFKSTDTVSDVKFSEILDHKPGFEQDPNLKCTVSLKHISKHFRVGFNKNKKVVDDL